MKQLILAVTLLTSTFSVAFAGGTIKSENDAAMKNGRVELSAKIQDLDLNIKNHNTTEATRLSGEILTLMRKGMAQTVTEMNMESKEQQKLTNARYLKLEQATHQYFLLSASVQANGPKLVEYAQGFMKQY